MLIRRASTLTVPKSIWIVLVRQSRRRPIVRHSRRTRTLPNRTRIQLNRRLHRFAPFSVRAWVIIHTSSLLLQLFATPLSQPHRDMSVVDLMTDQTRWPNGVH